ncbi:hypothetical protein HELRODRAFT_163392 [Helobdella robusta]|uniref:ABC transmembrane type-1 domain-containing protein n=1 Tax=Helobdella robusta TaxID=6412 RepID=T1ETZ8_HELRO|nr:hypothetical protein HELRODRAFT_163392 [Helobdella robusta]ESN96340.1 hypothetical protein HELRODRAFT_163392 [Helobdella robusta]
MTFYYGVSSGQIINRFSKDLDVLDLTLADLTHRIIYHLTSFVGTLVVVVITIPLYFSVVLILLFFFFALQHYYLPTVCQLKWLSSNSRSPIYTHVCETVDGLASIKAFNKQKMFVRKFEKLVNENISYECAINAADRWLGVNLGLIGAALTLFAGIFSIIGRHSLSGSIVGYCMASTFHDSFTLSRLIIVFSSIKIAMVSLERMKEYFKIEVESYDDDDEDDGKQQTKKKLSPSIIFHDGKIEFIKYSMKYREELNYALKNINLIIKPREKVGIMGSTGAGKSSLISALFRFSQSEGSIYVDNYDISKLPLKILRSNFSVLSQDPFIFSDTIRMNLDPTSEHKGSDAVIWKALEQCWPTSASVPGSNSAPQNFNPYLGRSYCCLFETCTALHLKCVTSSAVDVETDKLIQSTISREFKDCTVIIIAHRMSSTASCDRVLHMDQGVLRDG